MAKLENFEILSRNLNIRNNDEVYLNFKESESKDKLIAFFVM